MIEPDDDDINAMAKRLLSNGWASATPTPAPVSGAASDVYMVHWRKDEWIISRNGLKEWSGYDPSDLAQRKRMIEARGCKIEEAPAKMSATADSVRGPL
ncbi:MAG: hypothetical protein ACOH2N_04645 [Devosia sp.]